MPFVEIGLVLLNLTVRKTCPFPFLISALGSEVRPCGMHHALNDPAPWC